MARTITPRSEDHSQWYNDIVKHADLADHSDVRGCMVIKPYGFSIWESMKDDLDRRFKETGHVNAYFPLFIPKSYLSKEADHVEGFAKECAVVTHYRLKNDEEKGGVMVDPDARLEEELIVRPTSETIIWNSYKKWIQSYRDLPLLINQWANVVRWEMRTKLFLRTAEFLWQEGHTAHATRVEAVAEAERMLDVYADFATDVLAIPVIKGLKSANERFAGALETYCIEALMQDGKALQCGTSHFLGQNFAKAFDVRFQDQDGEERFVWATSWGVSTRLMGALIMTHSDDNGLILPPRVAPYHTVIVPFFNKKRPEMDEKLVARSREIADRLRAKGLRVAIDLDDTKRPGFKFAEYEMRGYPTRLVLGPRDYENDTVELARRDTLTKESVPTDDLDDLMPRLMDVIQNTLLSAARDRQDERTHDVADWESFQQRLNEGCLVRANWDGTDETEQRIKDETGATIRCIPLDDHTPDGPCVRTGASATHKVLFAKAH